MLQKYCFDYILVGMMVNTVATMREQHMASSLKIPLGPKYHPFQAARSQTTCLITSAILWIMGFST